MIVTSIRELAAALGISHTTLNKHFKAGRFQAEPGGGFDPLKVRGALKRNADFDQPSQAGRAQREPEEAETDDPVRRAFNRARAARETARAQEAQIDLKRRVGEVLDAAEVEAQWAHVGTRVKDEVMALPVRVVNRLPDEWRREVFTVLSEESRRTLKSISHEFEPLGEAA